RDQPLDGPLTEEDRAARPAASATVQRETGAESAGAEHPGAENAGAQNAGAEKAGAEGDGAQAEGPSEAALAPRAAAAGRKDPSKGTEWLIEGSSTVYRLIHLYAPAYSTFLSGVGWAEKIDPSAANGKNVFVSKNNGLRMEVSGSGKNIDITVGK